MRQKACRAGGRMAAPIRLLPHDCAARANSDRLQRASAGRVPRARCPAGPRQDCRLDHPAPRHPNSDVRAGLRPHGASRTRRAILARDWMARNCPRARRFGPTRIQRHLQASRRVRPADATCRVRHDSPRHVRAAATRILHARRPTPHGHVRPPPPKRRRRTVAIRRIRHHGHANGGPPRPLTPSKPPPLPVRNPDHRNIQTRRVKFCRSCHDRGRAPYLFGGRSARQIPVLTLGFCTHIRRMGAFSQTTLRS